MQYRIMKNDEEENEVIEDSEMEEVEPDYEQLYFELQKKHNRLLSVEASYREENKDLQKEIDELNSEIDMLKIEKIELLNRCDELEKKLECKRELPRSPIETADFLIHDRYTRGASELEKRMFGDCEQIEELRYTGDQLEQIAEHLLIYCKHNKGCEE